MIAILKEKLSRLPLRGTLLFFGTLLVIGYYRHGYLAALWMLCWASFFTAKFIIAVKRKVDRQLKINTLE
jgi:hypothetical protein